MMYSAYKLKGVTIYSLDVLLFLFGTSLLFTSDSNNYFLTCIQISQEASKVVWYSHLFQNFPQEETYKFTNMDNTVLQTLLPWASVYRAVEVQRRREFTGLG